MMVSVHANAVVHVSYIVSTLYPFLI